MGALTSKLYAFSYRSWELKSYSQYDLFDIFAFPIRIDVLNSSIVRILPRYNEKFLAIDWISDKTRFAYDSFEKQRILSPKILSRFENDSFFFLPVTLSVALKKFSLEIKKNNHYFFDFLIGNFFDLNVILFFKQFLVLLGPVRIFNEQVPDNLFFDLRSSFIIPLQDKDDIFSSFDFFCLIGLNLRLISPPLFSRLRLEKKQRNSFISLFSSFFDKIVFYNFNFGSKTINMVQFLTGKHFLSRFVITSKGLLFLFSREMFSFSQLINIFRAVAFRLNIKTDAFLIPAYLSSVSHFESGFSSFSNSFNFEKILFCLNDYNTSFSFFPNSYYIKVLFSFSYFKEENIFNKDLNFDYIFPLLNPFEENNVYIDWYGNLLRPWGGIYNGQIVSNIVKTLDLCYNLFITFFSSNLWSFKVLDSLKFYNFIKNVNTYSLYFENKKKNISFFKRKYFSFYSQNTSFIDKFSSNLNIINARKIFKIY